MSLFHIPSVFLLILVAIQWRPVTSSCGRRLEEALMDPYIPWVVRLATKNGVKLIATLIPSAGDTGSSDLLITTFNKEDLGRHELTAAVFADKGKTAILGPVMDIPPVSEGDGPNHGTNIRLLKLLKPVTFRANVQPICTPNLVTPTVSPGSSSNDSNTSPTAFPTDGFTAEWWLQERPNAFLGRVMERLAIVVNDVNCQRTGYVPESMFCVQLNFEKPLPGIPYYTHDDDGVYTIWGVYAYHVGENFHAYYKIAQYHVAVQMNRRPHGRNADRGRA